MGQGLREGSTAGTLYPGSVGAWKQEDDSINANFFL